MLNGIKIRELRNSKGYTTLDLSKFTKISKSYLEELERGDKKNPSFSKVVYIADALGVKVDDLILKA
ncbi:MAG: helix-turn-helix transcriptional regulator [Tissierellia bacterium]|nr:helix-turn-helix transcriptional regulator [Tissierellia bacterium]MDD4726566.1 helix-turn-helix transcriptional regulator [Tissierellia bacterium]